MSLIKEKLSLLHDENSDKLWPFLELTLIYIVYGLILFCLSLTEKSKLFNGYLMSTLTTLCLPEYSCLRLCGLFKGDHSTIYIYFQGCPVESIVPWLDDIYKQIPVSHTSARFYTCKANVIKSTLDLDAVLEVFEQATINNAQVKSLTLSC